MSFDSFGTHIFGDQTLQLPVHLLKLIMNGYLSSIRFKSNAWFITEKQTFCSVRDFSYTEKELLKLKNTMKTCLIRLSII